MKNGNMPAMPIELSGFGQYAPEVHTGLTKREYFAGLIMQGLMANYGNCEDLGGLAKSAVIRADELLEALSGTSA